MDTIRLIISFASGAIVFIATTITFLLKFIKNKKFKKAAEETLNIISVISPFVESAEKFTNYSGAEKKEFVLTKVNQFAIDNGVSFDPESVSKQIEELVNLTKKVNKREKDKEIKVEDNTNGTN